MEVKIGKQERLIGIVKERDTVLWIVLLTDKF